MMRSTKTLASAAIAEGLACRSWSVSPADTMIAVYDLTGYVGTITGELAINGASKYDRATLERVVERVRRDELKIASTEAASAPAVET